MALRHRQGGFTSFTLERPAAFVRRAHGVIAQRAEPLLARGEAALLQGASWLEHARTRTIDTCRRSLMHTRVTVHETVIPGLRRTRTNTLGAIARGRQRTRAAVNHRLAPRLHRVHAGASRAALRGFMWAEETRIHRVIPWLVRTQQLATQHTIHGLMWAQAALDRRVIPWAIETRADLRERLPTREQLVAAIQARREAGMPIWVALVLMVVTALITQAVAQQSVDRRNDLTARQVAQVFKAEQAAADVRAREILARESDELHRMFGSLMVWSMHNAMMRKNYDELDQYLSEIGKSDRVKFALLADLNGKVVAATDRTLKGSNFAQHFSPALLNEAVMAVQPMEGDFKRLVLPIERYSVRLGTAVMVYMPPRLGPIDRQ